MMENLSAWLIRTSGNLILGPYSKEVISEKILAGQLGAADEICPGNGYWMALYEKEEIEQLLGIRIPLFQLDEEEITKTDTQTATDVSDLRMLQQGMTVMAVKPPGSLDLAREQVNLNRMSTNASRRSIPFMGFWFVSGVLLFFIILLGIRLRSS